MHKQKPKRSHPYWLVASAVTGGSTARRNLQHRRCRRWHRRRLLLALLDGVGSTRRGQWKLSSTSMEAHPMPVEAPLSPVGSSAAGGSQHPRSPVVAPRQATGRLAAASGSTGVSALQHRRREGCVQCAALQQRASSRTKQRCITHNHLLAAA
jgi:hypothetical protein